MQQTPLEFDRAEGTSLVWNNGSRYKIKNIFVSEGTWPKGSTCAEPIQPAPPFELMWGVGCGLSAVRLSCPPHTRLPPGFCADDAWLLCAGARNPIPRVNDDNIGLRDPSSCPGPSGTSGPGCQQFPAPCPQDTGRLPWST